MIKSYFWRELFIRWVVFFKPKSVGVGLNSSEKKTLSDLKNQGWSSLGVYLDVATINSISKKLNRFKLEDRFRRDEGYFDLENVPPQTHVANYVVDDWSQIPEVLAIVNDPSILRVAEGYLGCKPTVSNIQAWWSFAGHQEAEQAENFHRDVDDWKFIKLFIYLTDVDEESGPHVYVQNSLYKLRNLRIARYQDSDIERLFGKDNVIHMLGVKGTAIIEDTFGFHKGQLAKTKNRLLLQVQYSICPIAIQSYKSNPTKLMYDPYINRLYLRQE